MQGTHTFLQWENKDQWRALQASEMRPVRLHEDGYLFIGDGGGVVRMKFEKLEQSTTSLSPRMNRLSGGSGLETRKNPKKEKDRFKDSQYVKIKVTSSNLQLLGYLHAHEVGTFGIVDSTKKSSSTSASQFVIVMEENENETAGPPINRLFSVRLNKYLCCENEQVSVNIYIPNICNSSFCCCMSYLFISCVIFLLGGWGRREGACSDF